MKKIELTVEIQLTFWPCGKAEVLELRLTASCAVFDTGESFFEGLVVGKEHRLKISSKDPTAS